MSAIPREPTRPGMPPTGWRVLFPHPVLSLQLGVTWLMLSHSLTLVHGLSALALAWAVPRLLAPFLGDASRLHWPTVVRLLLVVLWDIVVANITVARLTLGSMQRPRPAWLRVPLATDHPRVNALLASIITTTPGTVSMTIDEARREILVHALNCEDPQAMVADMKARYEAPLMRIFRVELDSLHGVRTGGQA
ncbi:MAG: Na+/H+ antiporter subunit E [Tepidimonas sp.]|uniref:Na+/H+ antiporter subunit E n=1 Tax=Tepidimonas sp. TaxID=2002775 RepID=UPI00259EEF0D|nr:Na+/H+ antiporter subunit E [Tepidimonas sp.]MDM7455807.1 Na+/H+ antiporter subunit E [Tepidimonas sp.]